MLRTIVARSLRFRGIVLALAFLAIGYGLYAASTARRDVFPEFAPPQVVIQTEASGLSPEEVEALVTRPIEAAVNGVGGLETIRSESIQGLAVVTATFREGTRILQARQLVGERLATLAGQLPQGVHAPAMVPSTSAASLVLVIGLTSQARSLMDLRTFADWTLRPRLLGVPGIAKVVVFGGEVRQMQVQVRPERLLGYGLAIDDVLAAARRATGVRGAGFVETEAQRIVLRTEGQRLTPTELGEAVLAHREGAVVRLRDVANVLNAPEPKVGDGAIDGHPGVLLVLSSQFGENTEEVTEAVERALDEMAPAFASERMTLHPALFRPASFVQTAIDNVMQSLLLGGVLVAVVLFVFLFDLRTAFISLTAIPLSLLGAVIVLDRLGLTLNTLTLGGLAIAIGEVVDDAIIDVENIFRRLRENQARGAPRPAFEVVLEASLEVRSAVVYATFVVALVFVPVLTLSGLQGRLFAPLGIAYILAVLASLVVAMTVTPALSLALLARGLGDGAEPRFILLLKRLYRRFLGGLTGRPTLLLGAALALCLGAVATLPFFGGSFLPDLREGHFIVHMSAVPGTSLRESLRVGAAVAEDLLRSPHIRSVAQQIGRAEKADDTWGTNYTEIHVDLRPLSGEEAEAVEDEIRRTLTKFPGVYFSMRTFLAERIEETLSGAGAQVVVNVFGDELGVIDETAREIARVLARVAGAVDVQVASPAGTPEMIVRLRPERLKQFGFRTLDVLDAVQAGYQGAVVGQTYEGSRVFDVTVILDPADRRDPESVGGLLLRNDAGLRIPLRELADVYPATGRSSVLHFATRRRQVVTCNVRGRDPASFVAEARRRIRAEVAFPAGVYPAFAGVTEARARAQRQLLVHASIAGAGIGLLLWLVFKSFRTLTLVLANLPFALVGGVIAVFVTGGWLSVGSLVGFVTLFGITMRNSIMMVSHFEHLVAVEGLTWGREAALRGASERLVPVLATALVTGLGLLPLAVGSGTPGREIEGPMAIVILGGLVTSTVLNLLVLPTLALRFGRFAGPPSP
ncbi:MAG: CusA/CzcA family heavy metal efflux RND transporter [Candidatus Rokuibacteriota bacterium]|nr:MAG: CusA/CzcA family heavy metal efflux RND transporter [Candidatus Rokubacteria bacterium]